MTIEIGLALCTGIRTSWARLGVDRVGRAKHSLWAFQAVGIIVLPREVIVRAGWTTRSITARCQQAPRVLSQRLIAQARTIAWGGVGTVEAAIPPGIAGFAAACRGLILVSTTRTGKADGLAQVSRKSARLARPRRRRASRAVVAKWAVVALGSGTKVRAVAVRP